jgi:FeS assembly SUF system regulator
VLRISKLADYGIVLLLHAAERGTDSVHTARDLASAASLPLPTVTKILKALARGGVVVSQRGKTGGYALSRAPKDVSVVDIITAIDGKPAMTQCTQAPRNPCIRESFCPAHPTWQVVHATMLKVLSSLTLADMASPTPDNDARRHFVALAGFTKRSA